MERMADVSRALLEETEHPSLSRAYAVGVQVLLDDPLMTAAFLGDHGVLGSCIGAVHDDRYRARHHLAVEWIATLQDRGALSTRVGPLTRHDLRSAIEALAVLVSSIEMD